MEIAVAPWQPQVGRSRKKKRSDGGAKKLVLLELKEEDTSYGGLKNSVPQASVLVPLLFNIYTYDLLSMISRKFAYAEDLALLHSSGNWKDLEETLS